MGTRAETAGNDFGGCCVLYEAEAVGFVRMRSFDTVKSIVEILFCDMEHNTDVNEIMDEAKILYKGMEKYVIKLCTDEIHGGIEKIGYPYQCLTNKEKAELFNFQLDDNRGRAR